MPYYALSLKPQKQHPAYEANKNTLPYYFNTVFCL